MGKWLNQLRENTKKPRDITDKTDKTASKSVLSVLSVRLGGVFVSLAPQSAGSVNFVSSQYEPFRDFGAFNDRHSGDWEECQFDFDKGMSFDEAELSAEGQLEAEPKRWMQ